MMPKYFLGLGWRILRAKVLYYKYPHLPNISDAEYDALEQDYELWCFFWGEEPTALQVGVDMARYAVQLVDSKIRKEFNLD